MKGIVLFALSFRQPLPTEGAADGGMDMDGIMLDEFVTDADKVGGTVPNPNPTPREIINKREAPRKTILLLFFISTGSA
jgi:hypothetical protein